MRMPVLLARLMGTRDDSAHILYGALVAQARLPVFYSDLGVPDTPDGRYDMIILHAFLLFERLRNTAEESAFAQSVFDAMFAELDQALREMGVGDMAVPKRIKRMAQAFYGRVAAYDEACKAGSAPMMEAAIARNIFPDEPEASHAADLARYAFAVRARLAKLAFGEIKRANLTFPEPVAGGMVR